MTRIELSDGKYTVLNDNGRLTAQRYGEPWRDLTGDGLVLAMAQEIERLKEAQNNYEFAKWRVGEYISSTRRPENVLVLSVGEEQIADHGAHRDFVRWVSP